jgi:hypothetical protein
MYTLYFQNPNPKIQKIQNNSKMPNIPRGRIYGGPRNTALKLYELGRFFIYKINPRGIETSVHENSADALEEKIPRCHDAEHHQRGMRNEIKEKKVRCAASQRHKKLMLRVNSERPIPMLRSHCESAEKRHEMK